MTTCATIRPLIEEYARGALGADAARPVDEHLQVCADCRAVAGAMSGLVGAGRARPALPAAYWPGILPRVRARIEDAAPFRLPAFALRVVSPVLAAAFLVLLALELVPAGKGGAEADASLLLGALPEDDLAAVAERHDAGALITLPAEAPETAAPDIGESDILQEIVEGEKAADVYAYLGVDAALDGLGDEDQAELISMLEQE
jgi:hypothetical protein